jgi:hypothetical protein
MLEPRQLSKASRAQLEARSKGWLQLRVAKLPEAQGCTDVDDHDDNDEVMV